MVTKVGFCIFLLLYAALAAVGQSKRENLKKCVSSDPDSSIAGCTALIQAGRESTAALVGAYTRRGSAYMQKKDYDRAIQDYNDAIRLNPKDAAVYNVRGSGYFWKGDYDRAIQDYNDAIRLNPKDSHALSSRGVAYIDMGDYDRAIQNYDDAIRLNPKYAYGYYDRGNAHAHRGDYDHAIKDLNEAIRLNPNFPDAYYNRGDVYLFQSNQTAAMADYQHVISTGASSINGIYAALMLHVTMKRQGSDDSQQLASVAHAADLSKWPGPLLKLDLGEMAADEVMAVATNAEGNAQKRQVCEANYFTGEDALSHDRPTIAVTRFKAARDSCPKESIGYDEALWELRRLSVQEAPVK